MKEGFCEVGYSAQITEKLAEVLSGMNYDCTWDGTAFTLNTWGLRIQAYDGKVREDPGRVMLSPVIVAYHRYLPSGFVRELSVGIAPTASAAVQYICASWMLLMFPLMKFLFEPHPHDCSVHETPVDFANAHRPYRLLAGATQWVGFGDDEQPPDASSMLLWNTFSDLAAERITDGVHHFRCFAGKIGGNVSADVFLDGVEWKEASDRLRMLAESFPEGDDEHPMYSLKQHLLVRPDDLEADLRQRRTTRLVEWTNALNERLAPEHQSLAPSILQAITVMASNSTREASIDELTAQGVDGHLANTLNSFLQSAAARVLLDGKVEFSDTYYLANPTTRRAARRRYDQTPVFTAGLAIFRILQDQNLAEPELSFIADGSAELNVFRQCSDDSLAKGTAKITETIHATDESVEGEDLDRIMDAIRRSVAPAPKPWWRFW